MPKKLATILSAAALAAAALLASPATAQAETHGPCGLHTADGQALYTNCTIWAVTFTVDVYQSGDFDRCVEAKRSDVYLGDAYDGTSGDVHGVKNVQYLDGSYCSWGG